MHGDGDVVGEQRQVHGRAEPAEVGGDLLGVGAGVEGRGRHQGVGAEFGGGPGVFEHAGSGGVDDPGEHRDPAGVRGLDHGLQRGGALGVGQVGDLAGGAEGEQTVYTAVDEVADEPGEGGGVDLPTVVERGADRRDDAVQGCGQVPW